MKTAISLILSLLIPVLAFSSETTVNIGERVEIYIVSVDGTAPFAYQWLKNGGIIPGATAASYIIESVVASSDAGYSVVVTNSAGSTRSDTARLNVNVPAGNAVLGVKRTVTTSATPPAP